MQAPADLDHYVPKEKKENFQNRIAKFIINSERNYTLTSNFIFNLFDVDANKVISVKEI